MFSRIGIPLILSIIGYGSVKLFSGLFTTEQSYKRCLNDLSSVHFGNKWVAAFELSKIFPHIKKEEYLDLFYQISHLNIQDERTLVFLIMTVAQLELEESREYLESFLDSKNPEMRMYALYGLTKLPLKNEKKYFTYFDQTKDSHFLQMLTYYIISSPYIYLLKDKAESYLEKPELESIGCTILFALSDERCIKNFQKFSQEIQKNFITASKSHQEVLKKIHHLNLDISVESHLRLLEKSFE